MGSGTKTSISSTTVREALAEALRTASRYNRSDTIPPAAVLWTDPERRWERVVPRLSEELPILTLGDYDPASLTGPAIWLRCAIEGTLEDVSLPEGTPVLYLPDVSRSDLRAVEGCPKPLRPLAELQYRGSLFTHKNGRDWTPSAFLGNTLGVEVAGDAATREALERSLPKFLDEPVEELKNHAPLKAPYFDSLLVPDPDREILRWLDAGGTYGEAPKVPGDEWAAFRRLCAGRYGFDPETDGEITAGRLLAEQKGAWRNVWRRFADAPAKHPNLPNLLDRARPERDTLFEAPAPYWPSDNREQEERLRESLLELSGGTAAKAREKISKLEAEHGERRGWVWAELAQAPLAVALRSISVLADLTTSHASGPAEEQAEHYAAEGWQVDRAFLEALALAKDERDSTAVRAAAEAVYRPWLEECAIRFQRVVAEAPLPTPPEMESFAEPEDGVCVLFTDGLRMDLSHRLAEILEERDFRVASNWRFGALPGVTATAKPATSPVGAMIGAGEGFESVVDGSRVTAESLRRLLRERGYEAPSGDVPPGGAAWVEFGDLDALGHGRGWRMAREVEGSLREIADRVSSLLDAGWREVRIVTDHGWLLLPGGLPKADLPEHLTTVRKGRCARLKRGARTDSQTVPWTLNPEVRVAVAPGIHAYEAGKEYEHGGLSPQECVVPILTATSSRPASSTAIESVKWTGLRCRVEVRDAPEGANIDLRARAADSGTSLAAAKPLEDGSASLFVEDDEREGESAIVVVLDADGRVLAQRATIVGG